MLDLFEVLVFFLPTVYHRHTTIWDNMSYFFPSILSKIQVVELSLIFTFYQVPAFNCSANNGPYRVWHIASSLFLQWRICLVFGGFYASVAQNQWPPVTKVVLLNWYPMVLWDNFTLFYPFLPPNSNPTTTFFSPPKKTYVPTKKHITA